VKWRIKFFCFYILVLLLALFNEKVFGNGLVIPYYFAEDPISRIITLTIMFIIGTYIELSLVNLKSEEIKLRKKDLLKPVFKVNLVTYPLTQILVYIFFIYITQFFWLFVLLIEISVILIEWQLLKFQLHRKDDKIPSKEILNNMILANVISFLVGLIGFIPVELITRNF
jgi:hypothetical protein